ncbi:MAG: hypothetical protein AAB257_01010 [Nitrospinota bacterium]
MVRITDVEDVDVSPLFIVTDGFIGAVLSVIFSLFPHEWRVMDKESVMKIR